MRLPSGMGTSTRLILIKTEPGIGYRLVSNEAA
jgi:hypothetical protein